MKKFLLIGAAALLLPALPAESRPRHHHKLTRAEQPARHEELRYSTDPTQYSNGYGTTAANSTPVTPITPYGGYVVNEYGNGNYVSGPLGFGGYPAGSPEAQIWRQRQEWKCQNVPESC